MGRIIEGVWDCQYCSTDKIRGSVYRCPVCGRTRDKDVKFYIDNPKNYVDNATAAKVSRNPDWLCSYCDALNHDDAKECYECGAGREDSEQNYFERREEVEARRAEKARQNGEPAPEQDNYNGIKITRGYGNDPAKFKPEGRVTMVGSAGDPWPDQSDNPQRFKKEFESYAKDHVKDKTGIDLDEVESKVKKVKSRTTTRKSNFNWGGFFKVGAGILAAVMVVMLLVALFTPKVMDVEVQDFSWNRGINVEELVTVEESGWSLPSGGRLKYQQQEIKGYEQVLDHYETKTRTYTEQVLDHYEDYVSGYRDLGNGFFEEIVSQRPVYRTETKTETYQEPVYRDEPIYATKYYYEIDKWQIQYTSKSSGNDKSPYWNEPTLKDKQREGSRSESYYVDFLTEEDGVQKYTVDKALWDKLNKGDKVTIKVVLGHAELAEED